MDATPDFVKIFVDAVAALTQYKIVVFLGGPDSRDNGKLTTKVISGGENKSGQLFHESESDWASALLPFHKFLKKSFGEHNTVAILGTLII